MKEGVDETKKHFISNFTIEIDKKIVFMKKGGILISSEIRYILKMISLTAV